jgi:hypothetical protein
MAARQRSERHGKDQARAVWPPEQGYFRLRLARGAWEVPCRIVRTEDGEWFAEIDGCAHASNPDPALAEGISIVWTYGFRTDEADFRWRLAVKAHAAAHGSPDHPALNPRRAISLMRLSPIQPRTPTP